MHARNWCVVCSASQVHFPEAILQPNNDSAELLLINFPDSADVIASLATASGMLQARATPLQPQEWQEMLRTAVPARSPSQASATDTNHEHHPPASPAAQQPWQEAQAATLAPHSSDSMPAELDSSTSDKMPGHRAGGQAGDTNNSGNAGLAGTSSSRPIVLDVRNGYEWDAGHFEGAARPQEVCLVKFHLFPASPCAGMLGVAICISSLLSLLPCVCILLYIPAVPICCLS